MYIFSTADFALRYNFFNGLFYIRNLNDVQQFFRNYHKFYIIIVDIILVDVYVFMVMLATLCVPTTSSFQ